MRRRHPLLVRGGIPVLALLCTVVTIGAAQALLPTQLPLRNHGVTVTAEGLASPAGVDQTVENDRFISGSSVLGSAHAAATAAERKLLDEQIAASRQWLHSGTVPGVGGAHQAMAERALLDLRALTGPDGAVQAAPVTMWRFTWPRDASFVVAAFAATGHHDDAEQVLRFLHRAAPTDGRWAARYRADGSPYGHDGRAPQLDGSGWVPWAVWSWWVRHPDADHATQVLTELAPMVIASADAAVAAIGPDGLPAVSPDYWERAETEVTLGTAAPLLAGLRAAIALAPALDVDPARWERAATDLDAATERTFVDRGFPRLASGGGTDSAVAFLAPPFAPPDHRVAAALRTTEEALAVPVGGVRPGADWPVDVGVAWTPSTAVLGLAAAGSGEPELARRLLTFLDQHRTDLGSLPEKVDSRGQPASVAPLAWTSASVLLTLVALEGDLPGL